MQKSLENINYRTTGICEMTVRIEVLSFWNTEKKILRTKTDKRFSERTIIMFLLYSGSQSGNRKHWHQSMRKPSYSLLKKTWHNFHTEVYVPKLGQVFYLNKENLALLLTLSTGKTEMEQVRQPHQAILN